MSVSEQLKTRLKSSVRSREETDELVDILNIPEVLALKLARATSTGVLDGLTLSVNADTSKFNIAPGLYEIVDITDINNPQVTTIDYPGSTANSLTNIAGQSLTYINLGPNGEIIQSANFPTPTERRLSAFVGRLNHSNGVSIEFANTFPDIKTSPVASFYDLVDAVAPFKIDNISLSTNGVNLSINHGAGSVFFRSENYVINKNDPHTKTFTSKILAPLRKMTRTTTVDSSDVTVIEPGFYDVAGTRTAIPGVNGRATIQRVYLYKSGAIRVAYGQEWFASFNIAVAALQTHLFIENPTVHQTAVLLGFIIVTKGCNDLTNPNQCLVLPSTRFGTSPGGGGANTSANGMEVSDTQTLGSGATVTLANVQRQRVKIQTSGGELPVVLPNGTRAAQELYVLGMDSSNSCKIVASGNVLQDSDIVFALGKMVNYVWDEVSIKWVKLT